MRTLGKLTALGLLLALSVQAQYRRHNFTAGTGAARPRGDLSLWFEDSAVLNVGYGFRFHPNFQFDAGWDTVFRAGRVNDYISTDFGDLTIRDYQFVVPVGGRTIIPLAANRVNIYGGGGFAYLRYTELLGQPSDYFKIDCRVCGSRHGVGYYATAGVSVALDHYQRFRLGFGTKVYRGNTDGDPVGAVPPLETKDRWTNVFGEFTFSF